MVLAGIGIFVLPVVLCGYHMWIESWNAVDWLVLYSFVYWPTYALGVFLIAAGLVIQKRINRLNKNIMSKKDDYKGKGEL